MSRADQSNLIYTVKLLDDDGNLELNKKNNPKYKMVNATAYNALVEMGRVELVATSVVNEGKIIRR